MKEYIVKNVEVTGLEDLLWDNIEKLNVDCFPWNGYAEGINTNVKAVYSDYGITVRFATDEKPLVMVKTEDNTAICEDSCMEFFFQNVLGKEYINIEVNPNGAFHIGLGKDRYERKKILINKSEFMYEKKITEDEWVMQYTVPFSFIEEYLGKHSNEMYANFYKCGDKTGHEHYACWNEIKSAKPDFHLSEFFGKLIFE